jgi:hypothetical protein
MTPLQRLRKMAREWGGRIVHSPDQFRKIQEDLDKRFDLDTPISLCPFDDDLAIDHARRLIVMRLAEPNLGNLIHEMGHVFASKIAPRDSEEWPFFGWEYMVAKQAGCLSNWLKSTENYLVIAKHGNIEFKYLDTFDKRRMLAERIRKARKLGLLKRGIPVSVRRSMNSRR